MNQDSRKLMYYLECSRTLIAQILDLVHCWEIKKSEPRLSAIAEFVERQLQLANQTFAISD